MIVLTNKKTGEEIVFPTPDNKPCSIELSGSNNILTNEIIEEREQSL